MMTPEETQKSALARMQRLAFAFYVAATEWRDIEEGEHIDDHVTDEGNHAMHWVDCLVERWEAVGQVHPPEQEDQPESFRIVETAAEIARLRGALGEVKDIYERNAGGDFDPWEYAQWMRDHASQALESSDD
jgi:hypothetical protein